MLKKIAVSLTLSSALLMGVSPLVVSDPTNDVANTAMIGHLVDSITKYKEMLAKAQEQIKVLGGISDFMNKTSSLLDSTNLTIANPSDLIKTLEDEMKRIERSAKRLEKSFANYKLSDEIKTKRLEERCPWLRLNSIEPKSMEMFFTDKGEDSPIIKDAKALFKILTEDAYANLQSQAGSLSGRALGEFMCERAIANEQDKRIEQTQAEIKQAILSGDKEGALEKRLQLVEEVKDYHKKRNEREREKWQPLVLRNQQFIEQMGVIDPSFNTDKVKYCEEGSNENGSFCYPVLLRSDEISNRLNEEIKSFQKGLVGAGQDKNALAKVYADYQQKTQPLVLEYLRNIAESLNFLNTTTNFYSSLFAEDYRKRYSTEEKHTEINNKSFATEENILSKTEMGITKVKAVEKDQYGFPTISSGKNGETRRAKNPYGL